MRVCWYLQHWSLLDHRWLFQTLLSCLHGRSRGVAAWPCQLWTVVVPSMCSQPDYTCPNITEQHWGTPWLMGDKTASLVFKCVTFYHQTLMIVLFKQFWQWSPNCYCLNFINTWRKLKLPEINPPLGSWDWFMKWWILKWWDCSTIKEYGLLI